MPSSEDVDYGHHAGLDDGPASDQEVFGLYGRPHLHILAASFLNDGNWACSTVDTFAAITIISTFG